MVRRSPPTDRVVRVLELLAANAGRPLTFSEISRRVRIPKATCHALLLSLTDAGYVVRDEESRGYHLGPALVGLGRASEQSYPYVTAVRHLLMDLLAEAGHSCAITAISGDVIVLLDHEGATGMDFLRRGNRIPFAAPYGVVHAAWAPEPVRKRWMRRDADTSRERAAEIANLLTEVRARGFSVAPFDEERRHLRELLALVKQDILSEDLHRLIQRTSGPVARDYLWAEIRARRHVPVSTISAPVFDVQDRVVFALHLQLLEDRVSVSEISRYADTLMRIAAQAHDVLAARMQRVAGAQPG